MCSSQGRRAYLEDHSAVVYASDFSLWSVYDGHNGASAAQFAAHHLPLALARHLDLKNPMPSQVFDAALALATL